MQAETLTPTAVPAAEGDEEDEEERTGGFRLRFIFAENPYFTNKVRRLLADMHLSLTSRYQQHGTAAALKDAAWCFWGTVPPEAGGVLTGISCLWYEHWSRQLPVASIMQWLIRDPHVAPRHPMPTFAGNDNDYACLLQELTRTVLTLHLATLYLPFAGADKDIPHGGQRRACAGACRGHRH